MASVVSLNPSQFRVEGFEGVGINVWDYGGKGPSLVLNHCTGTCARVWDPIVPSLLPHFHVYAPDTRGHGDSEKPQDPEAYGWRKCGEDFLRVAVALSPDAPILAVGHSAGAAHVAYTEFARKGSISRAVLIDPIVGPAQFFGKQNSLEEPARRRRNLFESRRAARARYASKPPLNAWTPETLDAYVTHAFRDLPDGTVELKCLGPIEAAVYARGGASDVFEHLDEIRCPIDLVTADRSDVQRLAKLQRTFLPDVRFHVLADTSHFIPQERPVEIADLILEAFREYR